MLIKRILQITVALAAVVPIAAGVAGILLGLNLVEAVTPASLPLDSHFRYLSGLLLGVGLGFLTTIPHIELKGARFRLLTAIVFIGGLARLLSWVVVGVPDRFMMFGLGMELVVTPSLAWVQYWVEKRLKVPARED